MPAAPYVYRYTTRRQFDDMQAAQWGYAWLSSAEKQIHAALRDPRRQSTFLLGRLLAKRLILLHFHTVPPPGRAAPHPAEIEIDSGLGRQRHEAPRVHIAGRPMPWSLSISHTDHAVLAALAYTPGVRVGVDLVEEAALGAGFASLWFTETERRHLEDGPPGMAAQLWAVKEAVYKATGNGRPFAPRSIEVVTDQQRGFICRPPCHLTVWSTPHGQTAAIAHIENTENHPVPGERS